MGNRPYYLASCSCGKDSLAMVLRLIEEERPLDEIVFYDTGMEFLAIYTNWMLLKQHAKAREIKCTRLTPKCPFEFSMTERIINEGKENEHKGYSWCGGVCRWGTSEKRQIIDAYAKQHGDTVQYIGIAHDEPERIAKEYKKRVEFPLDAWGMTEADCLEFCRKRGVNWNERSPMTATGFVDLYDILDRVSCWCCRNKNLWELRNIWHYLPEYWVKLKDLQAKLERPFKKGRSVFDLEAAFKAGYRPKHIKRKKKKGAEIMNKKHKNNGNRKSGIDLDAKGCHNCANCTYIGEGDYFCDEVTPTVVITGFSVPTGSYNACNGKRWKKQ